MHSQQMGIVHENRLSRSDNTAKSFRGEELLFNSYCLSKRAIFGVVIWAILRGEPIGAIGSMLTYAVLA